MAETSAVNPPGGDSRKLWRLFPVKRLRGGVEVFLLTDGGAVVGAEGAEDDGGEDGQDSQGYESFVDAVDHRGGVGVEAVGDEEGGGQAGGGDAEADRHLLHGAGDGAGGAGLLFGDVGVDQGVHAGVLQRREGSVAEGLQHNQPDRRGEADGREQQSSRPRMMVFEISTPR